MTKEIIITPATEKKKVEESTRKEKNK